MIRSGAYSTAIPMLVQVTREQRGSDAAIEAHYLLGAAYIAVGALEYGRQNYEEYLRLAPDGEHAEVVREQLSLLTVELGERNSGTGMTIDERIAEVQALVEAFPEELAHRLELADLYWRKAEYQKAGDIYAALLGRWPELCQDMVIQDRVERASDGSVTVLTPREVLRREAESNPLLIYNTSSFRSGRFEGFTRTFRETVFNVTGQVLNRSEAGIENVEVVITIFSFGAQVLDTRTIRIGRMSSGATRAFRASFTDLENIENVFDYDVEPVY